MSGRGRQPRTSVATSNGGQVNSSRSGRLITSTRSSSGSPSQRTRSLTPKVKGGLKSGNSTPSNNSANNSPANAASVTSRRGSAERRVNRRRPKFQDNPPAPEIVEKNALQLVAPVEPASQDVKEEEEEIDDVEVEEEEVDDDEDAAIRDAALNNSSTISTSSNGIHISAASKNNVGEAVSSVVEDLVDKVEQDKELNGSHIDDNDLGVKLHTAPHVAATLSLTELLQRELKLAVKDLIATAQQASSIKEEENSTTTSFESQLKACLHKQIKVSLKMANIHDQADATSAAAAATVADNKQQKHKVANPTLLFKNVLQLTTLDDNKKKSLVQELVSLLEMEIQQNKKAVKAELKLSDDTEESTTDSFPPDLVPQVDGVDSSAEGKSDDPPTSKEDVDQENNHEQANAATQNELTSPNVGNNESNPALETTTTGVHSNATTNNKCDKLKILSEMENKFAKETQNALKNRPVYKKRNKSESWDLKNGKDIPAENDQDNSPPSTKQMILLKEPGELEVVASTQESPDNKNDENIPLSSETTGAAASAATASSSSSSLREFRLRKFRKGSRNSTSSSLISPNSADDEQPIDDPEDGPPNITKGTTPPTTTPPKVRITMSPPPLTPEVGPSAVPSRGPLMIDIPDHYQSTPPLSSFSGGYQRRLMIRTPPAARSGLVTMVSEAVLSKEDAEVAATAVQLSPPPPLSVNVAKPSSNEDHPSLKIRLPKVTPNLVITSSSNQQVTASSSSSSNSNSSSTPHVKKAPKRRHLNESDGGIDTEEEEQDLHKRKRKDYEHQEKQSAGEETDGGGKATPDSQITNDDK